MIPCSHILRPMGGERADATLCLWVMNGRFPKLESSSFSALPSVHTSFEAKSFLCFPIEKLSLEGLYFQLFRGCKKVC